MTTNEILKMILGLVSLVLLILVFIDVLGTIVVYFQRRAISKKTDILLERVKKVELNNEMNNLYIMKMISRYPHIHRVIEMEINEDLIKRQSEKNEGTNDN